MLSYNLLNKKKPDFKAIITKKIEVNLEGDNSFYTAKDMKDAERIAEEIEQKAREEWKEYNDKERKRLIMQENLYINFSDFLESLDGRKTSKETWTREDLKNKLKEIEKEAKETADC